MARPVVLEVAHRLATIGGVRLRMMGGVQRRASNVQQAKNSAGVCRNGQR